MPKIITLFFAIYSHFMFNNEHKVYISAGQVDTAYGYRVEHKNNGMFLTKLDTCSKR